MLLVLALLCLLPEKHHRPTTWNMTRHATFRITSSSLCPLWHINQVDRTNSLNSVLRTANFPHRPSVFRRNAATVERRNHGLFFVAMDKTWGSVRPSQAAYSYVSITPLFS